MKALIILFTIAVILLFAGLSKRRRWLQPIAMAGTLAALGTLLFDLAGHRVDGLNAKFQSMFVFDGYAMAFGSVVLLSTVLLFGLSGWGFRRLEETLGDHYALILFSLCGAMCMFSFSNMVMLFLGIEILSIPLYVLAGSRREALESNEAALKYFLMGSFATGILLFGMTLVYGATASFDIASIQATIAGGRFSAPLMYAGLMFILAGLSFKVAAVPFHFWTPDVYSGSPNMITVFMSTIVKTAAFGAFYRLFSLAFPGLESFWSAPVAALAALTMTVANFTAIFQHDFKRMMAYSSVSHAGYLLLGILAIQQNGDSAILLYTLVYSVATICAFSVYMLLAEQNQDSGFDAFNGLGKKSPFLAAVMAISMLSLAGIPPTAGFFGKYFLFVSVFEQYPWLIAIAVINSAVSIYYYFKVIVAMYFTREENAYTTETPLAYQLVAIAGMLLIGLLTFAPGLVIGLI